jgi:alpha-amylase/alpha-mannosidase (GH57 family)
MEKFICIHGHFYQPPRENPWLESVEMQGSASPYHDWDERICWECYAPNARARLLDGDGRIEQIVSNYSQISFNFGPTLLSWLKEKQPDIHDAIVAADLEAQERFSGHGSALAQAYNHMIMPLANERDKDTQVIWGIRDFETRFGRKPEGMWLPECAADSASLDVLARHGIKFTILSPFQAARVRPLEGDAEWQDVNGGKIDPKAPYLVKLPEGRSIVVFFYDGPISRAIAFEKLLTNGETYAGRLLGAIDENRQQDQLVHVATDGESYGHHFQYGDMALAYALHEIERGDKAKLTVYGEYLEKHPPEQEVEIHQPSAWSCSHGVERWRSDCGCNAGHAGWNQQWRTPLREALDELSARLAEFFERKATEYLREPWKARDDYINVILDRSDETISAFFSRHQARELNEADRISATRLLEMQRHAMLMFTSCGWFFDEISGIETVQVIQYAARALQLATELGAENFEPRFLEILEKAKSNIPEHQNGRVVYEKFVKPAIMTRETVAAHYAISSLFESYPDEAKIFAYLVRQEDRQLWTKGNSRLAVGRIKVTFDVTRNSDVLTYGALYMGGHNLNCGVQYFQSQDAYNQLIADVHAAFEGADLAETIRALDRHFGEAHYSLKNLFRDEQYKVLNQILAATREDIYNSYKSLTDRYAPLAHFLNDVHMPSLEALAPAVEFVINAELQKQFENGHPDGERVRLLLEDARMTKARIEEDRLAFAAKKHFDRLSEELLKSPEDMELLQRFSSSAALLPILPRRVNLWKAQNVYDQLRATVLPRLDEPVNGKAEAWKEKFLTLGEQLGFHIDRKEPIPQKQAA